MLINEALNSLDEETRSLALDIFTLELSETAILNLGRADTEKGFFSRVLHLIDDPDGEKLDCGPLLTDAAATEPQPSTSADFFN